MTTELRLVLARAANGVIGKNNALPWHLPEDLAHFRQLTMGATVLMGRKTWESLPPRFRPLPGRRNLVLTHQTGWQAPGAIAVHSVSEALALEHVAGAGVQPGPIWVIGGAQVYAEALPLASAAIVTEIDAEFDGDAFAPHFGPQWRVTAREPHRSSTGLAFSFVTYQRDTTAS